MIHLITEQVVSLQLALVEADPTVCEEKHVPLLLGAYGASYSKADQIILKVSVYFIFISLNLFSS